MIGQTISHYQIIEKLGAGGMGVVYKAHDTTLDRDVALKFLAHSLKVNETDQARFLQEARSAALLNHPNICTIHDVLEVDEEQLGGKQSVIVMEYVDGKSLRDMLPVSTIKQASEVGRQIASGLATAHEKGLVHRDIKPENIMVFKGGGRAVIMDFGLAKLKGSLSLTRTGTTVGTVKYMSPEQICGGEVDHRSDIFSLGVVLYELFTGHSPFKGEHEAAVLYEIANGEPPLPSKFKPEIPGEIESLILECLAKDVNERIQSAAEVRRRLSAASGTSRTVAKTVAVKTGRVPSIGEQPEGAERKLLSLRSLPLLWALVAIFAIAFLSLGLLYVFRPSTGLDLSAVMVTPVAAEPENEEVGAFSPDGKSIAYVRSVGVRRQLVIKSLDPNALPTVLTSPIGQCKTVWSAKGDVIYFVNNNRLFSIGAAGGDPQPMFDSIPVHTMALSPDGNTLLLWAQTAPASGANNSLRDSVWSLLVSSPPGAPPRRLTSSALEMGYTQPVYIRISPDGSTAAVSKLRPGRERPDFWLVSLARARDDAPHEVLWLHEPFTMPPQFDWLSDSRTVVLASGGNLWFGDTQTGRMRRLTAIAPGAWSPNVSRDGKKILFSVGSSGAFYNADYDIVELPLDGSAPRPLIASSFKEHSPFWSASGERMAYVTARSGKDAIWIRKQKEDLRAVVTADQFTEDETSALIGPAISPDGKRIVYLRKGVNSGWQYFASPTDGGRPTPLGIQSLTVSAPSWSPDSKQIVTSVDRRGSRKRLVLKTVGSQDSARVLSSGPALLTPPSWSPKGDWIACGVEGDSIVLISPDGRKSRMLKSPVSTSNTTGACILAWKEDGTLLYIVSSTEDESRLDALDIATGKSRKIVGYGQSVEFASPWASGLNSSLEPGRNCLTTTVANYKCDLWVMEGFPDPATLW